MFIGVIMAGSRQGVLNYSSKLESTQRLHFSRHRSQARHRGEQYLLTFEQYIELWADVWHLKGRGSTNYCMTRRDTSLPWCVDNCRTMLRSEHLTLTKSGRRSAPPPQTPFDEWEIPDEIKHRL